ncbi:uncharacterized protein B0H18DRAFT_352284 [Fomitopsis serialis]|uniref:uncharacterized protein n=1 Tax=Fomitopsis serialis TaxID=139415 RepID=UPI0020082586|nr:uncharacterized protein B0H18DRAFT_352284 [Neoantrodia serialis]KAH9926161.1 hypothetical protein B0H18DRAFT_352284 [Neoantrodia serialis]
MNPDGIESSRDVPGQEEVCIESRANLHEETPASYHPSASIRSLPPEILTEIFSNAVSATSPELGVMDVSQDITTLSHVCSYWRGVAEHDARLWSTIVIRGTTSGDKSRLEEHLRRSCTWPIHVIIAPLHILDDDFRGCITGLHPHMHRIKRLFVKMKNSWVMENVIDCLTKPAVQLEELTLGLVRPEPDVDALATPFDFEAPYCYAPEPKAAALFDGNTPALRLVCLISVSLSSHPPIMRKLRHLTWNDEIECYPSVYPRHYEVAPGARTIFDVHAI